MKLLNNLHYHLTESLWRLRSIFSPKRYWTATRDKNLLDDDYGVIIEPEEWFKKYSVRKDGHNEGMGAKNT